jgi:hypothetical protein
MIERYEGKRTGSGRGGMERKWEGKRGNGKGRGNGEGGKGREERGNKSKGGRKRRVPGQ